MADTERFVGRQAELDLLAARLADAGAGVGGVVFVSGSAGIGKTRLVEEFLTVVDDSRVGWGAATPDVGMPALWPWTRALRGWPDLNSALASVAAGDEQREYGSAEDTAAATFAADTLVVDALEEQGRCNGPLVVVLDDLHWADRATRRLLGRVATEVRRLRVLVIGTYRDPVEIGRTSATEELHIGPLDASEARTLLSTAVDRADPSAVRRAADLSGGNPLYLRTLGRVAADQLRGDGSWDDSVGTAPEFQHLVTAALRAAGPVATAAVEALSVLGPEADLDLVAQLIGADTVATALDWLRAAVPAGLVELGQTDARVRFAHALVRDAAYAALAPSRRARLHRRAAELLEPRATGRDELAGAVARHWDRSGERGLAVAWAVRAADSARAAGAYDEAASYVEFALEATNRTGAGPVVDRAELLLDLARMQYLGGHIGASVRSCRDAAEEGERSGRAEVVARAAIMVQGLGGPDTNTHITQLCQRALAMLDAAAPSDLRATVEAQLACALTELDLVDEAEPWSRRALEDAEASGDANAELDAIRARVMLTWRSSDDDEVFALGGRAIELAGPTRRPLARLWAHTWRSDVAFRRADMGAVRLEMLEMQRLAEETGLPVVRWHLLRRQASLAGLTGDFDACRAHGRQAVAVAESWQDLSVRYTHVGQTACLALLRGDPSDVDPQWTEWVTGIGQQLPIARALIAAVLHLTGRDDEARALYETLVAVLASVRTPQQAAVLSYLVPLAIAYEDVASCLAIRDFVSTSYSGSPAIGSGTVFYYGSVARMLGRLSLAANEPAVATEHFEEGLRVDAAIGARPGVAEGRLGLAKALCANGEVTRGIELGRTAAAEARRLDMPGLLRQADAFLADAAAKVRTADNLTDREREVLALVAQALSNREVAAALVVSERTVESHVRNILAKTGLTSRTELLRWHLQRPR